MVDNLLKLRKNLKKKFRSRKNMFGGWISYSHPSITETFARMDIDFMAIDMEHSTISSQQAQRIISSSQGLNIPCLPRPVSHSNDIFKPILESRIINPFPGKLSSMFNGLNNLGCFLINS